MPYYRANYYIFPFHATHLRRICSALLSQSTPFRINLDNARAQIEQIHCIDSVINTTRALSISSNLWIEANRRGVRLSGGCTSRNRIGSMRRQRTNGCLSKIELFIWMDLSAWMVCATGDKFRSAFCWHLKRIDIIGLAGHNGDLYRSMCSIKVCKWAGEQLWKLCIRVRVFGFGMPGAAVQLPSEIIMKRELVVFGGLIVILFGFSLNKC